MATSKWAEEADKAAVAFHLALIKIGAEAAAKSILLWQTVPVTGPEDGGSRWLNAAVNLVVSERRRARRLARAYYRLVRALRTGRTIGTSGATETLGSLRNDFASLASTYKPESDGNERAIPVDILPSKSEAQYDAEIEGEAKTNLQALGPENLKKKLGDIDTGKTAEEVDAERKKAYDDVAARQAATFSRLVQDGARSDLWDVSSRDTGVVGYIRLSRTGTPCGWCAMLISRGPVYKSVRTGGGDINYNDGDLYHDNCNCYAEPIFSLTDYQTNPRYALNREYQKLWPIVTEGLGGKAALSAWRRFIRTTKQ